jgi:hypothetical protein
MTYETKNKEVINSKKSFGTKCVEFLFDTPLYSPLEEVDPDKFLDTIQNLKFRNYCPYCKEISIFKFVSVSTYTETTNTVKKIKYANPALITYCCTYNDSHNIYFLVKTQKGYTFLETTDLIIKIGQQPSFADLKSNDFSKYKKILSNEKIKELKKAQGLASHDTSIGAFIYLRRVFSHLIEKAEEKYINNNTSLPDDFKKYKAEEKIKLLKDFLPASLVQNSSLYSILSKGVHDLSEEECGIYYDIVYKAIIYILDEELINSKKVQDQKDLDDSINKIQSKLKTGIK